MEILVKGLASGYEVEHLARVFFPGAAVRAQGRGTEGPLVYARFGPGRMAAALRDEAGGVQVCVRRPAADGPAPKTQLCRLLYDLLCMATGHTPPWGMLTGVRPVRLLRRSAALGEGRAVLQGLYGVSEEKYQLLEKIDAVQKPVLAASVQNSYSLYISIPFCPTRCAYCSFVSRTIGREGHLVEPYLAMLCEELAETSRLAAECSLRLETIYIGGGTPTVLSAHALRVLLEAVAAHFDTAAVREYTVEAGRPDCTDAEKLALLKAFGVTRLSINPQTLQDEVLAGIGRQHTAEDIRRCFAEARAAGHENINMDLIAGLPGDTAKGFAQSLFGVLALAPENITVHSLTLKRGTDLQQGAHGSVSLPAEMLAGAYPALAGAGYAPYYLYRQKGTVQNLENTGWTRPGRVGLYNVYIMEETHTILAVGAGASTKLVGEDGQRIRRIFNHKYPAEYMAGFEALIGRKQEVKAFMPAIWIPKRLVEIGLINTAAENAESFARHCEIEYESRIVAAAEESVQAGCDIVMLTGPSASGKTTTANKLAAQLEKTGTHSVVVSLDNFYHDIDNYPRLPDGTKDYENVTALDIDEIHRCLLALIQQGEAEFPLFDFTTERRRAEREHIELQHGIIIVEGIHALNPLLTDVLPAGSVYKIYAGLREEYSHGGQRFLPTRDVRLARRMVRDNKFRGHSLDKTINMWPMVCDGEDMYIKSFKPYADLLLDTSFSYELCVLAPFVTSLRGALDGRPEADRLNDLADRFSLCTEIEESMIPASSMLREFIG